MLRPRLRRSKIQFATCKVFQDDTLPATYVFKTGLHTPPQEARQARASATSIRTARIKTVLLHAGINQPSQLQPAKPTNPHNYHTNGPTHSSARPAFTTGGCGHGRTPPALHESRKLLTCYLFPTQQARNEPRDPITRRYAPATLQQPLALKQASNTPPATTDQPLTQFGCPTATRLHPTDEENKETSTSPAHTPWCCGISVLPVLKVLP